jgi:hypothetical protein
MMRFAILVALLLPAWAESQTCVIEGHIGNMISGGPVRKAKVLLGVQGNPKYQAVTDNNGRYSMAGIAPGRYTLWVQRTGFLPVSFGAHGPNRPGKSIVLAPGEKRADLNFTLEPPGVITGHIYDQDGEPLSSAVILYREDWHDGHKRMMQTGGANADDEGLYRVFGLPAGTYIVSTVQTPVRPASPVPTREIYPPTFYPSTEEASAAITLKLVPGGEARNIDIRVRKTVSVDVRGSLVAQNLTPELRLTMQRRDGLPGNGSNIMYPQPGQFTARGVTPGSYILSARLPYEYARMDVEVGTLDVEGIELRLSPTLEVTGALKFDGAEPPAGTTFSLNLTTSELGERPVSALVDNDRHATWKGLIPGKWTLDFAPKLPGFYLKLPREIEIGPQGHEPVEVVLSSQGASVQGKVQVSAENKALVEASTVLLIAEAEKQPPRVLQYSITGMDGTFTLTRIPPGKYRLLALEDIETNTWEDPTVARTFEGKGVAIELGGSEKSTHDLLLSQP